MSDSPQTSPAPGLGRFSPVPALATGLVGAILPSLCCLVPAIVTGAGLGALAGLAGLSVLQPYAVAASLALMGFVGWRTIRRQVRCCVGRQRLALYLSPLLTLAAFAGMYGGSLYLLVPALYGPMGDMPGMP